MEAAKGSVDEGEANIARLEEQGIVVAADATVKGGETLRSELGANARFVIDLSVRLAIVAGQGAIATDDALRKTNTQILQLRRRTLIRLDQVFPLESGRISVWLHDGGALAEEASGRR